MKESRTKPRTGNDPASGPSLGPDDQLIEEIRGGNSAAFKTLVETYQNRVLGTCFRFLNNREEAEDAAQEVFVEVHLSLSTFRKQASLSTWIYRIAVTKCLDILRKKKRHKRGRGLKNYFSSSETTDQLPAPEKMGPDERWEAEERAQVLRRAVDALPRNQKIAITLGRLEGFDNREVASIMELSLSSVESLMHRARANLRKRLTRYYEGIYGNPPRPPQAPGKKRRQNG